VGRDGPASARSGNFSRLERRFLAKLKASGAPGVDKLILADSGCGKVELGRKERTPGAKARGFLKHLTARLKSCPDTKQSFSAACDCPCGLTATGGTLWAQDVDGWCLCERDPLW
jgi:hypothetical protein